LLWVCALAISGQAAAAPPMSVMNSRRFMFALIRSPRRRERAASAVLRGQALVRFTGLITSYKQLVSDQLGVDADRVDVIMGDTDRTPSGLSGGSRALAVGGAALHEAGRTIMEALARAVLPEQAAAVRVLQPIRRPILEVRRGAAPILLAWV